MCVVDAAQYAGRQRAISEQAAASIAMEKALQRFLDAQQALSGAAVKMNSLYEQVIASHKKEIASLAVDIAEKILARQIECGNYDIEAMICDVLASSPECENATVFVSAQDHSVITKLQQENNSILNNVRIVPDSRLGRAECKMETAKGIIESLLATKLKNIEMALAGADGNHEASSNN